MMELQAIKEVDKLLIGFENQIVSAQKLTRLTTPGENCGSLILAVDIFLKNKKNGESEVLNAIAKLIPPNEYLQEMFKIQVAFTNELDFYRGIVPILQNFRTQHAMEQLDAFPQCYGARINLSGGNVVDAEGVILLENLKYSGYMMLDRLHGFNLTTTKSIIKELAGFHATSLALKLTQPDLFESKIKKNLVGFTLPQEEIDRTVKVWEAVLNEDEETAALAPKILSILRRGPNKMPREPLATIVHQDLWINNIMVKSDGNEILGVKFVDFQVCDYRSPVADLIFLLFSSVSIETLAQHLDALISYYYEHFSTMLARLKCDTVEFSFEEILQDIGIEVKEAELFHIAFMVIIIFADRGTVSDIADIKRIVSDGKMNEIQKERIRFCVKEFSKRNWV